ncbi:MAG: GNAT family N-acetyltransferase, partial [Nocardioidaceae bacterium]
MGRQSRTGGPDDARRQVARPGCAQRRGRPAAAVAERGRDGDRGAGPSRPPHAGGRGSDADRIRRVAAQTPRADVARRVRALVHRGCSVRPSARRCRHHPCRTVPRHRRAWYQLLPGARGRGVASVAARLAADFAQRSRDDGGLGLRRLVAFTAADNVASNRVLEKTGFAVTGRE